MSPTRIHGAEYTIGNVFSDQFFFEIADYQRPYAWETEQAGELLDDLLTALMEGPGSVDTLNPYFLGSIVLIKRDSAPDAEVVDGQQRLTTLTILLAAIRSLVPPQYANAISKSLYQEGDPITNRPNSYRLLTRKRDRAFFRQYIQDEGGIEQLVAIDRATLTDSRRNFRDNAELFRKRLTTVPDAERIRLLQFIITRCFLVVVSTPDLTSAYRIFSVMNDRGMDLSPTDILKSETIGAIDGEAEQEHYAQIWESEEEDLGRDAFRELFAHIRTIKSKVKPQKTLLEEFRLYVQPGANPKKFIDELLRPYSDAYEYIRMASYVSSRRAEDVNKLFGWLNRIENFDWVPPAILFLSRNLQDADALVRFYTDLERLAASMMVTRVPLNDRLRRYGQLLSAIESNDDLYQTSSPLQLTTEERNEALLALSGDVYLMKPRLYVLLRLDAALSDAGAIYDHGILSVEHVLPQNPQPNSNWVRWFPTAEERVRYVHKLGNLLLLSRRKNSSAQNYDFDRKKTTYFSGSVANFALTNQVHLEHTWTPDVIERRQQVLVGTLKQLWRL
ncbi:MAG: hypothetical protein RLZZ387_3409 [Chloroflexota bacterium]